MRSQIDERSSSGLRLDGPAEQLRMGCSRKRLLQKSGVITYNSDMLDALIHGRIEQMAGVVVRSRHTMTWEWEHRSRGGQWTLTVGGWHVERRVLRSRFALEARVPCARYIQIVDDNAAVRAVLARVVAQLCPDVTVVEAALGAEALSAVTEHHPELSITDCHMPIMGGLELVRGSGQTKRRFVQRPISVGVHRESQFVWLADEPIQSMRLIGRSDRHAQPTHHVVWVDAEQL